MDLGWIWSGGGVVRGGQGMNLSKIYRMVGGQGWSGHGRVAKIWCGGREDAEKASKMCRSHILIASVRFLPFGFEIPEISSRDAQ